jgi:hypothetical protein
VTGPANFVVDAPVALFTAYTPSGFTQTLTVPVRLLDVLQFAVLLAHDAVIVQCPSGSPVTLSPVALSVTSPNVGAEPVPVPFVHTAAYGAGYDVVSVTVGVEPAIGPSELCTWRARVYSGAVAGTATLCGSTLTGTGAAVG